VFRFITKSQNCSYSDVFDTIFCNIRMKLIVDIDAKLPLLDCSKGFLADFSPYSNLLNTILVSKIQLPNFFFKLLQYQILHIRQLFMFKFIDMISLRKLSINFAFPSAQASFSPLIFSRFSTFKIAFCVFESFFFPRKLIFILLFRSEATEKIGENNNE
jgi:hypothetical protein